MGAHVSKAFDSANRTHLARELGMDRSHVSRVLNGEGVPSLTLAAQLAGLIGLNLDEFYRQWELRGKGRRLAA